MTGNSDVIDRLYPERAAGGFSRVDPVISFYSRVNALLQPNMTVVDLGAGRGHWAEILTGYSRSLIDLRGKCQRVIGIDRDAAVHQNPTLDESRIVHANAPLPLEDASVDIIISFAVLEHVDDPVAFAAEIRRVLRTGGWFCAWTPNKWGYVSIGARLIPDSLHARLLPTVSPGSLRQARDVFPTYYRMNTLGEIRRLFLDSEFENYSFATNGQPSYNLGSSIIARLLLLYGRLTPPILSQHLHVFLRRRTSFG